MVKIWKPKVTPMSELAPAEVKSLPESMTGDDNFIQKTSLAADKPVSYCFMIVSKHYMHYSDTVVYVASEYV